MVHRFQTTGTQMNNKRLLRELSCSWNLSKQFDATLNQSTMTGLKRFHSMRIQRPSYVAESCRDVNVTLNASNH